MCSIVEIIGNFDAYQLDVMLLNQVRMLEKNIAMTVFCLSCNRLIITDVLAQSNQPF